MPLEISSNASPCSACQLRFADTVRAPDASDSTRSGFACRGRLRRGEHLFHVGDGMPYVYLVRRGLLKTYVRTSGGNERDCALLTEDDFAGLDALAGGSQTRNAVALADSEVCRLPVESLLRACMGDQRQYNRLLAEMGRELKQMQSMLQRDEMTAEQRVATFLLDRARGPEPRGCFNRRAAPAWPETGSLRARDAASAHEETPAYPMVDLSMTRCDIARLLDLSAESVSRTLLRLQSLGCVIVEDAAVQLIDSGRLQQLARGFVLTAEAA